MRLLALSMCLAALVLAGTAQAATFSLNGSAQGGGMVDLHISNTVDTGFYIYRDGALIDHVTGIPIFHFDESGQPIGVHTYQAKGQCRQTPLGLRCLDASNQLQINVT